MFVLDYADARIHVGRVKLSCKARYGLQAVFDLAYHAGRGSAQGKDIAERQEIPARFLEQIFQDLKRAGIVIARRGPKGGYQLSRPASEVSVGDVIRALEGPCELASAQGKRESATDAALVDLGLQIDALLDAMTFEALCERAEERGESRRPGGPLMYAI